MRADATSTSDTVPGPFVEANVAARLELMHALSGRIQSWNLTQEAAARRLGIGRPRLNNLLRGKIAKFSLDALVNLAAHSGLAVHIELADGAEPN